MTLNHRQRLHLPALLLACGSLYCATAAGDPTTGFVEAGITSHSLTNNYGNWSGQYLRGNLKSDERNTWNAELVNQREFGDRGTLLTFGDTHIFNPDWSGSLSAATSDGGFFYPRFRIDAAAYRKWGERKEWVSSLGVGYFQAKDAHRDNNLFLGLAYYFQSPWIVEGGIRFVSSNPGAVASNSQFAAVTHGHEHDQLITLRYGFGKEAYQIIGPGAVISNFNSHETALIWRQWMKPDWGFNLRLENYGNPNYQRSGVSLGLFKEF